MAPEDRPLLVQMPEKYLLFFSKEYYYFYYITPETEYMYNCNLGPIDLSGRNHVSTIMHFTAGLRAHAKE